MMTETKTCRSAHLALIGATILWSTSFVVLKLSFKLYNPHFIIFGRLTVAFIILAIFIKPIMKGNHYKKGDAPLLIIMSLFEPCFYFIFESLALQNTTSSQAGIISSLLPLLVAITGAIILKEYISMRSLSGFIIAAIGAISLGFYASTDVSAPNPILGNFYEFIAMICAAGYTIVLRKLSFRYNPFMLTIIQSLTGSLFFLPIVYASENGIPTTFKLMPIIAIVYMGIFVSLIAYTLFNYGIGKVKAARGSAYINLIPIFSLLWGWIFLGETLNSSQKISCAVIIAGLYLSQYKGRLKFSPKNSD